MRLLIPCVVFATACTNPIGSGPGGPGPNSGTRDIRLVDGGIPPPSCECQRRTDNEGCFGPPSCGGCTMTCPGIAVPVCSPANTLPDPGSCVTPLPDGGFFLPDGGPNFTPAGSWSQYEIKCIETGCPNRWDCGDPATADVVIHCGNEEPGGGPLYCVPGGSSPGCNSDIPPPDGGDFTTRCCG